MKALSQNLFFGPVIPASHLHQ